MTVPHISGPQTLHCSSLYISSLLSRLWLPGAEIPTPKTLEIRHVTFASDNSIFKNFHHLLQCYSLPSSAFYNPTTLNYFFRKTYAINIHIYCICPSKINNNMNLKAKCVVFNPINLKSKYLIGSVAKFIIQ